MDKTVLVTGAASGIGLASARLLLEDGCRILAFDPQEDRMRSELPSCEEISFFGGDVSKTEDCGAAVKQTVSEFGGLDALLGRTEILVCLLPLTPETEGILDADLFAKMPKGACLINAARGGHLIDEDLIPALESGRLAHATQDVVRTEPLAADHLF